MNSFYLFVIKGFTVSRYSRIYPDILEYLDTLKYSGVRWIFLNNTFCEKETEVLNHVINKFYLIPFKFKYLIVNQWIKTN